MSGDSDSSLWQQFFPADSPFQQPAADNMNDGNVTVYGRNQMSSGLTQPDSLTQSGYGYWSEASTFTNQPIGRPAAAAAAIWSNGQAFGPLSFASPATPITNVPPGFSNSSLNPQAAPWSRSTGYGIARQPDYLTGSAGTLYTRAYGTSSSSGRGNYMSASVDMAALEEQFRDFKLKPKILTEPFRPDGPAGRKSRSRTRRPNPVQCVFCMSNGEDEKVYRSHMLKDPDGRVVCPVLRLYSCPVCNNNGGDNAHTIKYCPKNKPNHKNLILKSQGQADMTQSLRSGYAFSLHNRK